MSNHPYPEHVLDAVEEALRDKLYEGALPVQLAEAALQAIWDASRVDAVSEVDQLPREAMLRTRIGELTFAGTMRQMTASGDYPAHVVYWGDRDA